MRDNLVAMLGSKLLDFDLNYKLSDLLSYNFHVNKKPRWIIFRFARGIGYYNGKVMVMNGDQQVAFYEFPVLEEFDNKHFAIHNTAITRSKRIVSIRIHNYDMRVPSTLNIQLSNNVSDPRLVSRLNVLQEIEIKVTILG
jgi:hypothetical protein